MCSGCLVARWRVAMAQCLQEENVFSTPFLHLRERYIPGASSKEIKQAWLSGIFYQKNNKKELKNLCTSFGGMNVGTE